MDDPGDLRLKILLCMEIERDPSRGSARALAAALRRELEAQLAIAEMREPLPVTKPSKRPP